MPTCSSRRLWTFDLLAQNVVPYALAVSPTVALVVAVLGYPLNVSAPLMLAMLVLFPEGRLPSWRWRWILWLAGASGLLQVAGRLPYVAQVGAIGQCVQPSRHGDDERVGGAGSVPTRKRPEWIAAVTRVWSSGSSNDAWPAASAAYTRGLSRINHHRVVVLGRELRVGQQH